MPMFFRTCRHRFTKSAKWGAFDTVPLPLSASGASAPPRPASPPVLGNSHSVLWRCCLSDRQDTQAMKKLVPTIFRVLLYHTRPTWSNFRKNRSVKKWKKEISCAAPRSHPRSWRWSAHLCTNCVRNNLSCRIMTSVATYLQLQVIHCKPATLPAISVSYMYIIYGILDYDCCSV